MNKIFFVVLIILIANFNPVSANAQTEINGWKLPTGSSKTCGYLSFLSYNKDFNGYHLAIDICTGEGSPIYAIGDGEVVGSNSEIGSYGARGTKGGAMAIRHKSADGYFFIALYGHLNKMLPKGNTVTKGQIIGYANDYNPPHLHFGIHKGYDLPGSWYLGYTKMQDETYGFVDPMLFLRTHAGSVSSSPIVQSPPRIDSINPNEVTLNEGGWLTVRGANFQNGMKAQVWTPEGGPWVIAPAGINVSSSNEVRVFVKMGGNISYRATLELINPNRQATRSDFLVKSSGEQNRRPRRPSL